MTYESHGHSYSRTYRSWSSMKQRCYNPKTTGYEYYGGRGVTVCAKWRGSFEAFLDDMGERPIGKTLDRINNDGPYEPGNCRWADKDTQSRNQSRSHYLTLNGETMVLEDWAERLGLWPRSLRGRLKRGWPLEKALTLPATVKNGRPTQFAEKDNRNSDGSFGRTCA